MKKLAMCVLVAATAVAVPVVAMAAAGSSGPSSISTQSKSGGLGSLFGSKQSIPGDAPSECYATPTNPWWFSGKTPNSKNSTCYYVQNNVTGIETIQNGNKTFAKSSPVIQVKLYTGSSPTLCGWGHGIHHQRQFTGASGYFYFPDDDKSQDKCQGTSSHMVISTTTKMGNGELAYAPLSVSTTCEPTTPMSPVAYPVVVTNTQAVVSCAGNTCTYTPGTMKLLGNLCGG